MLAIGEPRVCERATELPGRERRRISRAASCIIVANDSDRRVTSAEHAARWAELSNLSDTLAEFASELDKNGLPGTLRWLWQCWRAAAHWAWAVNYSSRLYRRSVPRYG